MFTDGSFTLVYFLCVFVYEATGYWNWNNVLYQGHLTFEPEDWESECKNIVCIIMKVELFRKFDLLWVMDATTVVCKARCFNLTYVQEAVLKYVKRECIFYKSVWFKSMSWCYIMNLIYFEICFGLKDSQHIKKFSLALRYWYCVI